MDDKLINKLVNYISILEGQIRRIKEEYYSPDAVRAKEKYFRDHNYSYRKEIKELKAQLKESESKYSDFVEGAMTDYSQKDAEIRRLKDILDYLQEQY